MSAVPTIAAPTMSAVGDTAASAVVLTVLTPADAVELIVWRKGDSGVSDYVRGASPLVITGGGEIIVRDFEAPIGMLLTYGAAVRDSGGVLSPIAETTVTLPSGGCDDTWLVDIARPTNTQQVTIERLDELNFEVDAGVHYILDRRTPIVTSAPARAAAFELNFLTETLEERDKAQATLGNGTPVLLKTPPENGIGNVYFACLNWKEQRIVNQATLPDRRFLVDCVQVDRPDAALFVPGNTSTYAGVLASYATYQAIIDAIPTYNDLFFTGFDPSLPSNVIPWPSPDV